MKACVTVTPIVEHARFQVHSAPDPNPPQQSVLGLVWVWGRDYLVNTLASSLRLHDNTGRALRFLVGHRPSCVYLMYIIAQLIIEGYGA